MAENDTLIGKQIGRYKIEKLIGRGGMASVYRAVDVPLGRIVAMKIIHQGVALSGEGLARFKQEASLIIQLEHAHLIPVYDYNVENDPPYIIMRYVDGGTLAEVIKEKRIVPLTEIAHVFNEIAGALEYAHQRGVIHRDIKPSNIMIDRSGSAFLTDFGIARMTGATAMTATSMAVGTPGYMSPEQGQSSLSVDYRTDIYALGVILFEMATGHPPYTGDDPLNLLVAHLTQPIPSARAFNRKLPTAFDAIIQRALAKQPEDRYSSVLALTRDIETVAGGRIAANETPTMLQKLAEDSAINSPTRPDMPSIKQAASSRWPLIAAGTIIVILLALIVVLLATQGDEDTTTPENTQVAAGVIETAEQESANTNEAATTTQQAADAILAETQVAVEAATELAAENALAIAATQTQVRLDLFDTNTAIAMTDQAFEIQLTDNARETERVAIPTNIEATNAAVANLTAISIAQATTDARSTANSETAIANMTAIAQEILAAQTQQAQATATAESAVTRQAANVIVTSTAQAQSTLDAQQTATQSDNATANALATLAESTRRVEATETAQQEALEAQQTLDAATPIQTAVRMTVNGIPVPQNTSAHSTYGLQQIVDYAVAQGLVAEDESAEFANKFQLATDGGLQMSNRTLVLRPVGIDNVVFIDFYLRSYSIMTINFDNDVAIIITVEEQDHIYASCALTPGSEVFNCFVPFDAVVQNEAVQPLLIVENITAFLVEPGNTENLISYMPIGDEIEPLGKAEIDGETWYYILSMFRGVERGGWVIGTDVRVNNDSLIPVIDPDNPPQP